MSRLARLLVVVLSTMSILMTLVGTVPSIADAQQRDESDSESKRPFERRPVPRPEIDVPNDRRTSPPEPGPAPDEPVAVEDRRTIIPNVEPDERALQSEPESEELDESTTREGTPTPQKPETVKPVVEPGFVPGLSDYLADESTPTRHVWKNEDGTISVRYTITPSTADPLTGEIRAIERRFENNGKGPVVTGEHGPAIQVPGHADKDQNTPIASIGIGVDGMELEIRVGRDNNPNRDNVDNDERTQENPNQPDKEERSPNKPGNDVEGDTTDNGSVVYPDLVEGAAVEVFALNDGVRIDFIIQEAAAGLGLTQTVELPKGWSVKQDNGVILLLDESGERAGVWAGGLATDISGIPGATAVRLSIVEQNGQSVTASVDVSEEWLNDKERVFPVRIDPTYQLWSGGARDTWMYPGFNTPLGSHGVLVVGDAATKYETLLDFNVDFDDGLLSGSSVIDASVYLTVQDTTACGNAHLESRRNTAEWDEATVVYSNKPAFADDGDPGVTFSNCGQGWVAAMPITQTVRYWAANPDSQYGITVLLEDGTSYRDFYSRENTSSNSYDPYMHVNYNVPNHLAVYIPIGDDGAGNPIDARLPEPNGEDGAFPIAAFNLGAANWSSGENPDLLNPTAAQKICLAYHSNPAGNNSTTSWQTWEGLRTCPTADASQMYDYWTALVAGTTLPTTSRQVGLAAGIDGNDHSTPGVHQVYFTMIQEGVLWYESGPSQLADPQQIRWTEPPQHTSPISGSLYSADEFITLEWEAPYAGTTSEWAPHEYRVRIWRNGVSDPIELITTSTTRLITPAMLEGYVGTITWTVEARDKDNEAVNGPQHWTNVESSTIVIQTASLGMPPMAEQFSGADPTSGNHYSSFTDLAINSVSPNLGLVRHHNSSDQSKGIFGPGITTNLEMSFHCVDGCLASSTEQTRRLQRADGSSVLFSGNATTLTSVDDTETIATRTSVGAVYRWEIVYPNGSSIGFEQPSGGGYNWGDLADMTDVHGNVLDVTSNPSTGYPTRAEDITSGRFIDFTYESYFPYFPSSTVVKTAATGVVGADEYQKITYNYDASHYLTSACDLEGFCDTYTWLATGQPDTQVWPSNGRKNTLTYDVEGRVLTITNGKSETTSFTYTTATKTDINDGRGLNWSVEYNSPGVPTKITNPANGSTTYTYTNGLRTGITDANGNSSTLTYIDNEGSHDNNQLLSRTNDEGETTYYQYDASNYADTDYVTGPSHVCDARSANAADGTYCTESTYDSFGRKISQRLPGESAAEAEEWVYTTGSEAAIGGGTTPAGLLKTHRDGNISATGGEGTTTYGYNKEGDLVQQTTPSGLITTWTHDDLGRVLSKSVTYTDNGSTATHVVETIAYDQAGRIETVTGPAVTNPVTNETHQLKSTFDVDGNGLIDEKVETDIGSTTNPDPTRVWSYAQDELDREIAAEDPLAPFDTTHHPIKREYDANGNVTAVTDAAGNRVETIYNNRNLPTTVTAINFNDGHGNTANRVLSWSDYDAAGRLIETMSYRSATEYVHTKLEYDTTDRLIKTKILVDGIWRTVEHNVYTNGLLQTSKSGNTALTVVGQDLSETSYSYEADGRIESTTVNGRTSSFDYDTAGNVTSLVSSGDYTIDSTMLTTTTETRSVYDSAGNPTRIETENGAQDLITTFGYDERGLLTSTVGPRGNAVGATPADFKVSTDYDVLGRLNLATAPAVDVEYGTSTSGIEASWATATTSPTTEVGYDTYGNATHSVDALGQITVTDYDLNARPVTITHPSYTHPTNGTITPTEIWDYDQNGNVTDYTTRLGNHTTYAFDDANRVVKQTDPQIPDPSNPTVTLAAGETTSFYDYAGRAIKTINPEGAVTEQAFDDLGRVETSTVTVRAVDTQPAQSADTSFEYSWLGYLTKVTDPTGVETSSAYDAFGSPTSTQVAAFAPTTYMYDGAGRPVRTTTSAGAYTTVTYDQAGRAITTVETGSDNIDYRTTSTTYDASGAVLTQTTGRGGVTTYDYNEIGFLTGVNLQVDDTSSIDYSYGYDAAGNTTRVTDGDGYVTRYVYNEWGLMTHTLEPKAVTGSSEPESDRLFIVGYNPAGQSNYEYSPGGRILTRSYNNLALPVLETTSQTGLATVGRDWAYNRSSQTVQVSHPTAPILFTYDDRGLLVTQTGGAGDASFEYDEAGRTLSRSDEAGNNTFSYSPTTGQLDTVTNGTSSGGSGSGGGSGGPLDVLFLVDDPASLSSTEDRINTHLADENHIVTLRDANATEETSPGDLIIVGHAGGLGNKYETQTTPILELQPAHWDNHELTTGNPGTQWATDMVITDATHDLAGGLTGTQGFLTTSKGISHVASTQLHADADVVAETNVSDRVTLFGYETGDSLAGGGTAPGRRVGLSGLHNTNATPTPAGWTLFDAAVDWAANNTGGSTPPPSGTWDIQYDYDAVTGRLEFVTYADGGKRTYTYDEMGRTDADVVTNDLDVVTASTTFTYSCDHEMIGKDVELPTGTELNAYTYDHAGRLTSWDSAATTTPETCPGTSSGGSGSGSGSGGPLDVLFLVDDPASLSSTEDRINTHLIDENHTVTLRDANATEETSPGDLIIVGHAGGLGNKYETQTTPILELQPAHWDNHELTTGNPGTQWATDMVITDATHDLAGGLTGTQGFLTTSKGISHVASTQLHADADVVAETNVSDRVTLFGYEAGDSLAGGGTAPGRRVGLSGLHNTNATPTPAGWTLFDSAVDWAANNTGGGTPPPPATGGTWPTAGEVYTYDNRGNRLTAGSETFTYDNRNRLTTDPDGAYTWNSDGTLDVFTPTSGSVEDYTFDAGARLTQVSDGTDTTDYGYDALDRISTRNSAAFTYSGGELDPTGDGTDLFHRTPGGGLLAYETPAATTFAYSPSHHDLNGLIGSDGNLTDSRTYDPYGDPVAETGSTDPVLGYQSDYTDPVTEHVWMGARWYQPSSATFLSRDTVFGELRTPFTLNRYTYGVNNPIGYWDPDGRKGCRSDRECTNAARQETRDAARQEARDRANAAAAKANYWKNKTEVETEKQNECKALPWTCFGGTTASDEADAAQDKNGELLEPDPVFFGPEHPYLTRPQEVIDDLYYRYGHGWAQPSRQRENPYEYYPDNESMTQLSELFSLGLVDYAKLGIESFSLVPFGLRGQVPIYDPDQDAQAAVLRDSLSHISGPSLSPANEKVIVDVLEWSGAMGITECGSNSRNEGVYCVPVTRLPSLDGGDALTIGNFILWDVDDVEGAGRNHTSANANFKDLNLGLWAHEMAHIDQWAAEGSEMFGGYLLDPNSYECRADKVAPGNYGGSGC